MGKHRRRFALIRLLARLGWQRDPALWTIRCQDRSGRRAALRIHLTTAGIDLLPSVPGPLALSPLQAGHLRAAVRDALLSFDRLARPHDCEAADTTRPAEQAASAPLPHNGAACPRRIRLDPLPRPSVAELASRATISGPSPMEDRHADHGATNDDNACGSVRRTTVAA
jgi:hypothetical protein